MTAPEDARRFFSLTFPGEGEQDAKKQNAERFARLFRPAD